MNSSPGTPGSAEPAAQGRMLLVTNHLEERPRGGRELLCRLNHDVLAALYGDALVVHHLDARTQRSRPSLGAALRGHVDGVSRASMAEVEALARGLPRLEKVFIDGSNLGALAARLKRRLPQVEVITFFHNVEARFFWGSLRSRRTVHAAGVLVANYMAERQAVRGSDKRVCLSERDSALLRKVYGRKATHIAPMALQDKGGAAPAAAQAGIREPFALFVGGTFYANRQGMEWYVDQVAAQVDVPVVVVGRGFADLRSRLEIPGRVQVVGEVDDLAAWYADALFVIAPIFDGSGMKTKVAEALMHGKRVVGTPEAFSGYEDALPAAGWVCADPGAFARAMQAARIEGRRGVDQALRQLYLDRYSASAAERRMGMILNDRRVLT